MIEIKQKDVEESSLNPSLANMKIVEKRRAFG